MPDVGVVVCETMVRIELTTRWPSAFDGPGRATAKRHVRGEVYAAPLEHAGPEAPNADAHQHASATRSAKFMRPIATDVYAQSARGAE